MSQQDVLAALMSELASVNVAQVLSEHGPNHKRTKSQVVIAPDMGDTVRRYFAYRVACGLALVELHKEHERIHDRMMLRLTEGKIAGKTDDELDASMQDFKPDHTLIMKREEVASERLAAADFLLGLQVNYQFPETHNKGQLFFCEDGAIACEAGGSGVDHVAEAIAAGATAGDGIIEAIIMSGALGRRRR